MGNCLYMSNKDTVKKLFSLLIVYTKEIAVIIGCLLISTVLNLCVPLLSRRIMDDGFIGVTKRCWYNWHYVLFWFT